MNNIEKQVLRKIVAELFVQGWYVTVDYEYGYDSEPENRNMTDLEKVIEAADAVDECWIMVDKEPREIGTYNGFIHLIWDNGNEGRDCITDYSMNLEPVMGPISEWTEEVEC